MKFPSKLVLLLAVNLSVVAHFAKADTFSYAYLFGDGLSVTGSFSGTLNGNFVDNVSNVSLYFDGSAVPGSSIVTASYDGSTFVDGPAIVSFDAFSSNFLFRSSDFDVGFYLVNAAVYSANTATAYAFTDDLFVVSSEETSQRGTWSLRVTSVPEGGSTGALIGLALICLYFLRRNQGQRATC